MEPKNVDKVNNNGGNTRGILIQVITFTKSISFHVNPLNFMMAFGIRALAGMYIMIKKIRIHHDFAFFFLSMLAISV